MAELKFQYDSEDTIPEHVRTLYRENDGKWQLDADGAVSKARLDEFRSSNIELRRQVESLKQQFGDLSADDVKALKEQQAEIEAERQRLKEEKLLDEKKIDELIAERTKKLIEEREKGFKERDTKLEAATRQLRHLTITTKLQEAATVAKLEPWAIQDAVMLGERVFDLDDQGNVIAFETDLTTGMRHTRYDANGEPLTIAAWLAEEVAKRPGWLPASAGGGAHHQNGSPGTRSTALRKSEMSAPDRARYISEHGRDAYVALPR